MTDWRLLAKHANNVVGTPCFIMSERIVCDALRKLQSLESSIRLRHWLSLKTQPVPPLVRSAITWGLGAEVVSQFELEAAISSGVAADHILVNGVGKHHWLPSCRLSNLSVHFDSVAEASALAEIAKALHWRVGLRCAIEQQLAGTEQRKATDWDQFGMTVDELRSTAALLIDADIAVSGLHFHLHTNVRAASDYGRALHTVGKVAATAQLEPEYIDVGGGLPICQELSVNGASASSRFDFAEFGALLQTIPTIVPSVREVWLENGRFLTGAAGALVITVIDRKERGGCTYLICDGGLTNHARPTATEAHDILLEPKREGSLRRTIVCGPTCGAVDRLGCWALPDSVVPGDRIILLNAGAYHIPLETRFSFGLAPLVWFDEKGESKVIRERETPAEWWAQWTASGRATNVAFRHVRALRSKLSSHDRFHADAI